jgi:hypothetical protein
MMMSFIFRCINSGGRVAQFEVFLDQKSSCSVHNVLPVNKTIPPIVHLLAACCPLDARSSILIILLLSLFFFFFTFATNGLYKTGCHFNTTTPVC